MIPDHEYHAALRYYGDILRVKAAVALPESEDLGRHFRTTILGIGSRESAWGTSRLLDIAGPGGRGDHGHGHGLMQIDDRWHATYIETGAWSDAASNIAYGVSVLLDCWRYLRRKEIRDPVLLRAAIAAYNAGPYRVYQALLRGDDPDRPTTGGDYSKDVLARGRWYVQRLKADFPEGVIGTVPTLPPDPIL
jgi:hypothetical protein